MGTTELPWRLVLQLWRSGGKPAYVGRPPLAPHIRALPKLWSVFVDKAINIAVDGPASSGKGTVARLVAAALGYAYIDSGAMYRAVALFARRKGHSWEDEGALVDTVQQLRFGFAWEDAKLRVSVNGEDVTDLLRHENIGQGASMVALFPEVRRCLLEQQRTMGAHGGIVMDGRDIGTVVLPNARLKIFLDASVRERAIRRTQELQRRGEPAVLEDVETELTARDAQDRNRKTAPLLQASDAVYIDTTGLSADEVAGEIVQMAKMRIGEMP